MKDFGDFSDLYHYGESEFDALDSYQPPKTELPKSRFNTGLGRASNDFLTAVGQGTLQLPSAATGLADIVPSAFGVNRPVDKATDAIGSYTGFQPKKWAQDAEQGYSDETKQAVANVNQAWDSPDTNALDIAKAYAQNPASIGKTVATSLPSMFAGGILSRATGLANPVAGAAVGEGAVMAGQSMENIDKSVDPQKAALISAGVGGLGGVFGAASGKMATKLGLPDPDVLMAGGAKQATTLPLTKRVLGSAAQEGLIEEGGQSAVETLGQNYAEDKPLTEGLARNVTEGVLAGSAMGGLSGVVGGRNLQGQDNVQPIQETSADINGGGVVAPDQGTAPIDYATGGGQARSDGLAGDTGVGNPFDQFDNVQPPLTTESQAETLAGDEFSDLYNYGKQDEAKTPENFIGDANPDNQAGNQSRGIAVDSLPKQSRETQNDQGNDGQGNPGENRQRDISQGGMLDIGDNNLVELQRIREGGNGQGNIGGQRSNEANGESISNSDQQYDQSINTETTDVESQLPENASPLPYINQDSVKPVTKKDTSSWIIREKDTGKTIFETWDKKKVDALNTAKYEAVPALQHLQELNQEGSKVRQADLGQPIPTEAPTTQDRRGLNVDNITKFKRRKDDQKAYVGQLKDKAYRHELTGLPNKRAFYEGEPSKYVASIDADSLKFINDNLGHQSGDELLKHIGNALAKHGNNTFHISGDELYVKADDATQLETALKAAQEDLVSGQYHVAGDAGRFTRPGFSYGIAQVGEGGDNVTRMNNALKAADVILQNNKLQREKLGLRAGRGMQPPGFEALKTPTRSQYHPSTGAMVNDLQEGGGVAYQTDEHGKITGRTPSVNPDWFKNMQLHKADGTPYAKQPSVKEIKEAYAVHAGGNKLTGRQSLILESLSDIAADNEARAMRDEEENRAYEQALKFAEVNNELGATTLTPKQAEAFWNDFDTKAETESNRASEQQAGTQEAFEGDGEAGGRGGEGGSQAEANQGEVDKRNVGDVFLSQPINDLAVKAPDRKSFHAALLGIMQDGTEEQKANVFSELGIKKGINIDSFKKAADTYYGNKAHQRKVFKKDSKTKAIESRVDNLMDFARNEYQRNRQRLSNINRTYLQSQGTTAADIKSWLNPIQKRLLDAGKIKVIQSYAEPGVQAYFDADGITVVSGSINDKEHLNAVLAHEAFHWAREHDKAISKQLEAIDAQFKRSFDLAAKGIGSESELAAYRRVMSANTPENQRIEEFQSYMIENSTGAGSTLKRAILNLISMIKLALARFGFSPKNYTVNDLAMIAKVSMVKNVNIGKNTDRRNSVIPVISISGEEITGDTPSEVRANAKAFVDELINKLIAEKGISEIKNIPMNKNVLLTKKGVVHGFQHKGEAQVKAVAAIKQLIETAYPAESKPHEPENDVYKTVHNLVAPLEISGNLYAVKLAVKEDADGGLKLYDHQVRELSEPDSAISKPGQPQSGLSGRPISGLKISVAQLSTAFNIGTNTDKRYSKAGDDALSEAKRKAGFGVKPTLSDTIKSVFNRGIKANKDAFNDYLDELLPTIEQGVFDKFLGIKRAENKVLGDIAHSQSGYIGARLSTGSSSTMAAVLQHGAPILKDGIIQRKEGSKGLSEILQPVKNDLENFAAWMVGRRAKRLMGEGKENNFSREEIDALMGLGKPEYKQVADGIAAMNKAVLDLAEASGLVNAESRVLFEHSDYIPFYRMVEGKPKGVRGKSGLSHQTSGIRVLKGGESPLSDPIGNMMMNWAHLVDASMKNNALDKTITNLDGSWFVDKVPNVQFKQAIIPMSEIKGALRDANMPKEYVDALPKEVTNGIAKMYAMQAPTDKDIVRVMRGGKAEYYRVNDGMLLTSLTAVNQVQLDGIFKPMRYFKRLLTGAVTADPTFIARNFIRDSMHSWVIAEEKGFKFGIDSVKGALKTLKEDGGYVDMMFAGASFQGGYGNYSNPDNARKTMDSVLRKRGIKDAKGFQDSILDTPKKMFEAYRAFGDAIENASREAVLDAGKKAGKEKAEYLYEAKDLMDFSMQGSFTIMRALSDMLPFFNARVQGLYRLARAGKTKQLKRYILMKGLSITMLSLALLALNSDDDRYEELEDWQKDAYWHFFVGENHFRIPKPFELGLLFGTIPERSARLLLGKDTGKEFAGSMAKGVSETLAFNPVPQMFKPMLELYANRDMFTARPIENMGDEGKLPSARYNESTSMTMRALSNILPEDLGASPKRLEHLMHGYLGALGMYALGISDWAVRKAYGMPDLPEKRMGEYPVIKAFYQETPALHNKYGTEFYDMLSEVNQISKTINAYRKEGNIEKANELAAENIDKLRYRKGLASANKSLSALRSQIDRVYRSDLSPDEKRRKIDELTRLSSQITKLAVLPGRSAFI